MLIYIPDVQVYLSAHIHLLVLGIYVHTHMDMNLSMLLYTQFTYFRSCTNAHFRTCTR